MRLETIHAALRRAWLRMALPGSHAALLRPIDPYQDWIQLNRLNRRRQDDLAAALQDQRARLPRISVVMPVYRPDFSLLDAAISSVQAQSFADWQLCICDDGNNDTKLAEFLVKRAEQDPRILVTSPPANSGIAAATNTAANLAKGDVLLFLDQDDLLAENCLAEFALAFASDADVDLVYSDHDKIDRHGRRYDPQFKPAWSPTLLLSHMYCGHALALRRSLFNAVGGMQSKYDGSQDYDLVLRATELARQVRHLPKVLYHWRALPGSTAVSADEKPGSIAAGQACLDEALQRRAIPAGPVQSTWAHSKAVALFELAFAQGTDPLTVVAFARGGRILDPCWLDKLRAALPARACILSLPGDGTPLGARLSRLSSQLPGHDIVLIEAGLELGSGNPIEQLIGYAALAGNGLSGPLLVGRNGKIAAAGMVVPEGAESPEPALSGMPRDRAGMCYAAQAAHECAALPASCLVIHHRQADLLAQLPLDEDDPAALGLSLCEALRRRGGRPVCVASTTVTVSFRLPHPRSLRTMSADQWYNPNLGGIPRQYQPARRLPAPHRPRTVRLAAVTHNLDREGAQLMLLELLAGLRARQVCEAVVFSPRDGELRQDFEAAGIEVMTVNTPPRRTGGLVLDAHIDHLATLFRRDDFDVILANTLESYPAVLAAQRAGIASVWWQHEGGKWNTYFGKLGLRTRALAYASLALPYRVVQVAESTRRKWLPISTRANFEVVRNAIGPTRVSAITSGHDRAEARTTLGLAEQDCCILLVGSVSARKGQGDMVAALARMDRDIAARVRILIVGKQVDRNYCRKLAKAISRLPADRRARISLVGAVPDPAPYYAAADIFVCCSRQESAPLAISEAMAAGLPIVSTAVDGIPELVVFGQNARKYDYYNSLKLTHVLTKLVTSHTDCKRLGQAGRVRFLLVNDHERMIRRFAQILGEAALLRSKGPSLPD